MWQGPGLTIGNVKNVKGNISISNSRVRNTRGCGLAMYKKEILGAFVRLSAISFENVAVGYPLLPGHTKPGCDPTGACQAILLVGGTDKVNAPAATMGGIVFDGPCVISDSVDRSFFRATNTGFTLEQIAGSFTVSNPNGCTVMIQNGTNQPPRPLKPTNASLWNNAGGGVSLDTRCHIVMKTDDAYVPSERATPPPPMRPPVIPPAQYLWGLNQAEGMGPERSPQEMVRLTSAEMALLRDEIGINSIRVFIHPTLLGIPQKSWNGPESIRYSDYIATLNFTEMVRTMHAVSVVSRFES